MNITDLFIDILISKSQNIPENVYLQAKKCLLDYSGVTIGGLKYLKEKKPKFIAPIASVAFINGFAAHGLELDDGHRHGMIHLGACIVSAILDVAKKEHLKYDDILRGIVMGYEVAVRCACALQPGHKMRGYHVTGTCGTIGSAMGIAFACGYSYVQIKTTLACAVSSAAGLLEIQEQASELKPYNVGRAAFDGLLAAHMGKLAVPGPDDILGGKRGFLSVLTDSPKPDFLTELKGEEYCIEGIYQKVYAACRHCHPAIDAALEIRNNVVIKPKQVDKIEVFTYKLAIDGHSHTMIQGVSSAKLSTPFSVALAIVKGSASYQDYNEDTLNNDIIKQLTQTVCVIEDEKLTKQSPNIRGAKVIIYLHDGKSYGSLCLNPKGEPENPLSQQELEEKFRGLAMYGGLTNEECDEVIKDIWKDDFDIKKIMNIVCR